jgi:ABC-type multidrug transport system fused ATPase/permease subunit
LEKSGDLELSTRVGLAIEMKNFTFEFEAGKPVLDSIDLHIESGEKIQIVGSEGSGKSLFMRILTGNYIDFRGTLLINNVPIKNYSLANLRKHTGILLQDQEIFQGTVYENISLGKTEITPSLILETAKELGISDFLNHFPRGFDSNIEPIGKKTPQTIVKKILLLRALCGDKRLLLLENPWNGLEAELAEKLRMYLLHKSNTTVIISTNDPAGFEHKLVINNGKI